MNMTPHAAFGHVLIENTYADGEIWNSIINDDIKCTTFWVKGLFKNKQLSVSAEDVIADFLPGHFLRPADYVSGMFEHTSVGESKVFCFDPRLSNNEDVEIAPFSLKAGSQTILSKGTKLFMCFGNLLVGERSISQPTQISVQSGDLQATASSDCYGLLFQ